jgi:hypothetical protein
MEQLPATLQFLPPDKLREQDPVLRMMCVEILLLLSTCKYSISLVRLGLTFQHIQAEKRYENGAHTLLSGKPTKLRKSKMYVCSQPGVNHY